MHSAFSLNADCAPKSNQFFYLAWRALASIKLLIHICQNRYQNFRQQAFLFGAAQGPVFIGQGFLTGALDDPDYLVVDLICPEAPKNAVSMIASGIPFPGENF